MKTLSILLLTSIAAVSGCSTVANNAANNANLRGTNTNTGYVTNVNQVTKPTVPPNATNLTPGNVMPSNTGNSNSRPMNGNANAKPMASSTKKP